MKENVVQLFNNYPHYALIISIAINIIIAVIGVIPSVFITAANVLFFGFWQGTLISFIGESIGAIIAFTLYRLGFKKSIEKKNFKNYKINKLLQAQGKDAFLLILSLRLLPFIPSGIVTFTAAIGRVSAITFIVSSSLGKIPSLLIEAYAAYEVVEFGWQGKLILFLCGVYLLYFIFKKKDKAT